MLKDTIPVQLFQNPLPFTRRGEFHGEARRYGVTWRRRGGGMDFLNAKDMQMLVFQ